MKKRTLALILAAVFALSLTACNNDDPYSDGVSDAYSDLASDSADSSDGESGSGEESSAPLSNPVKKTDDGDIDMEAALAYETDFEALKKSLSEREVDLSQPVSLNARNNPETMKVWKYLKECYGSKIISAQQQMDLKGTFEDKVYYNALEDLPAMKGFDFIFSTGSYVDRGFVDAAIEWGQKSDGLATFCWHWNVPVDVDNPDKGYAFYMNENGVKIENWSALNATTPGTKEYEIAVHDMDLIASYLQELEAAGITVLWRPFHEASGSWFWWGVQPSDRDAIRDGTYETYQRLWYMMFDRFENYHKLSNLIWVWNGQSKYCEVDPNTYDISGTDVYPDKEDHSPQTAKYEELKKITYEGKMLALTECGYIPDPQQCADEGAMWLYYMPWNGDFIFEPITKGSGTPRCDLFGTPYPNTERLSNELLKEYFGNSALVSWKDLPQFIGERNVPDIISLWAMTKAPSE
ncbi:MAG: glycoside hydrolase family 26 protein [Lachnospiraceae bacterium]|nr:glycoside hydrolase family 26 protein [Ruminococcus sp.]MCM1274849.1 glycoside hydrolase family 26 protein [Lachnospiraceae bacterium]